MNRLLVVIGVLLCWYTGVKAENISLSGNVVESGTGTGISGVKISLHTATESTTTGADGSFVINTASTLSGLTRNIEAQPFTLSNKMLVFKASSGNVAAGVELFTGSGRRIAAFRTGNLKAGSQSIILPELAAGITLMRVIIGEKVYTGSLHSLGGRLSLRCRDVGSASSDDGNAFAKRHSASAVDTIVASKTGYVTQYYPLESFSAENIVIEMEKQTGNTDISLLTTSVEIVGSGATAEGTDVIISSAGTYIIHGTLTDGRIVVRTEDEEDVILLLDGVAVSNSTTSPLFIENAKNTYIELADGSDNTFSDGSEYSVFYEDDEPNATIFSKDDLFIGGGGKMTVTSNYNDAIACKDELTITGGNVTINSVDDGIRGKDNLVITGGTLRLNVEGDGLRSTDSGDVSTGYISIEDGAIEITAGKDAIQASNYVEISGGEFTLTTGGGSKSSVGTDATAKGIKATNAIQISGGTFTLNCADDGIHSNGTITVSNGTFTISSADDGVHADSAFTMDGGDITIAKSYEGFESMHITLNGGRASIIASDDGMNVAGGNDGSGMGGPRPGDWSTTTATSDMLLQINDGYFSVIAGGDGLDANGSIEINGGTVLVHGPERGGNGVFDIGDGGGYTFIINGGTVIGAGTSDMVVTPGTSSQQNCLSAYISKSAGVLLNLQNADGENLFTFSPELTYGYVLFSSPELVNGTYSFFYGGSVSGGTEDGGLYENETYTPGTTLAEVTVSSRITKIGSGGRDGGFRP